jgi:hypothetical protein
MLKNPLLLAFFQQRAGVIRLGWSDRRLLSFLLLGLALLVATHVLLRTQLNSLLNEVLVHHGLTLIIVGTYYFVAALVLCRRIPRDHSASWLATTTVDQSQIQHYVRYRLFEFALMRSAIVLFLAIYLSLAATAGSSIGWEASWLSAKISLLICVVTVLAWVVGQSLPPTWGFSGRRTRPMRKYLSLKGNGRQALARLSLARLQRHAGNSQVAAFWVVPILLSLPIGVSVLAASLLVASWLLIGTCLRLGWIHGQAIRQVVAWFGATPLTLRHAVRLLSPGPILFCLTGLGGLLGLGILLDVPVVTSIVAIAIAIALIGVATALGFGVPQYSSTPKHHR